VWSNLDDITGENRFARRTEWDWDVPVLLGVGKPELEVEIIHGTSASLALAWWLRSGGLEVEEVFEGLQLRVRRSSIE